MTKFTDYALDKNAVEFKKEFERVVSDKVNNTLDALKIHVASTMFTAPDITEAKHSYEPEIHRSGEHEDPKTHPANHKPDAVVDIEDGRKALVFHNYDYKKGVGHGNHTYVRKTDGDDDYVYHNHPKVPAEKVKRDFTNLDEAARKKGESHAEWKTGTKSDIASSDKRKKVKVTSAELEARARARRGESDKKD